VSTVLFPGFAFAAEVELSQDNPGPRYRFPPPVVVALPPGGADIDAPTAPPQPALGVDLGDVLGAMQPLVHSDASPPEPVADRSGDAAAVVAYPSMDVSRSYDDNVYAAHSKQIGDWTTVVSPTLDFTTDWQRHGLNLDAGAAIGRSDRQTLNDYEDFHVTAAGLYDLSDALASALSLTQSRDHEPRGDPNDPGTAAHLTTYDTSTVKFDLGYEGDWLTVRPAIQYQHITYANPDIATIGQRNRDEYLATARIQAELTQDLGLLFEPLVVRHSYLGEAAPGQPGRDGTTAQGTIGLAWSPSELTYAELGVGYQRESFDDPSVKTVSTPTFSLALRWSPFETISIIALAGRSLQEAAFVGVSTIVETQTGVTFAYVPDDDWSFSTNYLRNESEYQSTTGIGPNRIDVSQTVGVTAIYHLNEHFDFSLGFINTRRTSPIVIDNYGDNRYMLQVSTKW